MAFHDSLIGALVEEFNKRYKLGISSFMELENIDKSLNDIDRKYQALKNFTRNRYDNEQMFNALIKVDEIEIKKLL